MLLNRANKSRAGEGLLDFITVCKSCGRVLHLTLSILRRSLHPHPMIMNGFFATLAKQIIHIQRNLQEGICMQKTTRPNCDSEFLFGWLNLFLSLGH